MHGGSKVCEVWGAEGYIDNTDIQSEADRIGHQKSVVSVYQICAWLANVSTWKCTDHAYTRTYTEGLALDSGEAIVLTLCSQWLSFIIVLLSHCANNNWVRQLHGMARKKVTCKVSYLMNQVDTSICVYTAIWAVHSYQPQRCPKATVNSWPYSQKTYWGMKT